MSLFFFGNNFYKNKETFKVFSPHIVKVYRILLVEPTLESIMFYYTFSVIKTIFVPRTSTRTLVFLEYFLCNPSDLFSNDALSCLWIVFTNFFFQVLPQKIVRRVEILGMGWLGVIGFTRNASVPWELLPDILKCFVREMR